MAEHFEMYRIYSKMEKDELIHDRNETKRLEALYRLRLKLLQARDPALELIRSHGDDAELLTHYDMHFHEKIFEHMVNIDFIDKVLLEKFQYKHENFFKKKYILFNVMDIVKLLPNDI